MANDDEKIALVLQGGGALGAYQAGAFEELQAAGLEPDWVAGISIGAINASIIAGNKPDDQVKRLRAFWEGVSAGVQGQNLWEGEFGRILFNEVSAGFVAAFGIPGFFHPRFPPPFLHAPGAPEALSFYDTSPLRETLLGLVDFDRLNSGDGARLSLGAVNVRSGNFTYFDTADRTLAPEHIMASGALPPGFPPIVIDGEPYWDGGLVSNTPLQYVLDSGQRHDDMCIFQVDLFPAEGVVPRSLAEVSQREKDIRFSSRTRLNTDVFRQSQTMRRAAKRLADKLPPELKDDPDAKLLREFARDAAITVVHLIHRPVSYETMSKDYEFSRLSVEEHWQAGRNDVRRTLRDRRWKERVKPKDGVLVLDLTKERR